MDGFDVGIIGAGVHGASAAYHLASRSLRVVVFERDTPAGGPTGRSSAVCRAFYTNEFLAGVARDSIRMMTNFAEHTNGRDSGYRRTGLLFLHPDEDAVQLRTVAARLRGIGISIEILAGGGLVERLPRFDLEGIGVAAWEPEGGYADPASTTLGLLERAIELGAEPRMRAGRTRIEARPGGGATVLTQDGTRTECDRLLIAAGPWSGALARQVCVELPLTVERHLVAALAWGRVEPISFGYADLPGGYYCRPEGEHLLILGSLHPAPQADPDAFSQEIAEGESSHLTDPLLRRMPSLADAEPRRGWASLYDVSPDWQPVIGEIGDRIYVDAGTSGHGFKLAPALGRHVADLVAGDPVDPGLSQFHPVRFREGRPLAAGYRTARILG
jgi:glycine/D-amino acid oxidase-like deaminating enzyme